MDDYYVSIQTVKVDERMLSGVYRFKIVDALTHKPVKGMEGDYTVSPHEMGTWKSDQDGEVFLDKLKVGLTNIQVKDDKKYFDILINGAKVQSSSAAENKVPGRNVLAVPRKLENELIISMTWLNKDYNVNLFAETFIDSEQGRADGNSCQIGFTNPQCYGMEHLDSREVDVLGETIRLDSRLFFDEETN